MWGLSRNRLPSGLLLLCLEIAIIFSATQVEAKKQQCHLKPRDQAVLQPPTNPGTGGGSSSDSATSTPTVPVANPSTSVPTPTATPFKYGTDKVRGVNLYVFSRVLGLDEV